MLYVKKTALLFGLRQRLLVVVDEVLLEVGHDGLVAFVLHRELAWDN